MYELFYYEGLWYMVEVPEFVLTPFEFDLMADIRRSQALRDWQWSLALAPPPMSPVIVTGV